MQMVHEAERKEKERQARSVNPHDLPSAQIYQRIDDIRTRLSPEQQLQLKEHQKLLELAVDDQIRAKTIELYDFAFGMLPEADRNIELAKQRREAAKTRQSRQREVAFMKRQTPSGGMPVEPEKSG